MKRLLLMLGLAVLLVVLAGVGLLGTESGNRWLIRTALNRYVPDLSIADIHGTVLGTLHASGIRFVDGTLSVEVDELAIDAELFPLFGGRAIVRRLEAGQVKITDPGGDEPGGETRDLFLPVFLDLDTARVSGVLAHIGTTRIHFSDLDIEKVTGREELRFARVAFTQADAALRVEVSGRLGLHTDLPADIEFDWQAGDVAGSGSAAGNLDELALRHTLASPLRLQTEGTASLRDGLAFDATTRWEELSWTFPDAPALWSPGGSVRTTGNLDSARVSGAATLGLNERDLDVELVGVANLSSMSIEALDVRAGDAVLAASGQFGWDPVLNWDLAVEASYVDPELFAPGWPGRLSGAAGFSGRYDNTGLHWALASARASGELRGDALMASGDLSGDPSMMRLDEVRVELGDNVLTAGGDIGEQVSLAFSIDAAELSLLDPGLSGRIYGDGTLDGPRVRPGVTARFTASELRRGEFSVGAMDITARLGSESTAPFELDMTAQDLVTPLTAIDTVEATTRGTPSGHDIAITTRREQMNVTLQAAGRLEERLWTGSVKQFELVPTPGEPWRLEEPAALTIAHRGDVQLENLCLQQAPARVCVAATMVDGELTHIKGALTSFDLVQLQPWLGENLSLRGGYEATLDVTRVDAGLVADAEIHGAATEIALQRAGRQPLAAGFEAINGKGRIDAQQADLSLTAAGSQDSNLRIDINVQEPYSTDGALSGRIDADWRDLKLLSMLVPELDMGQSRLKVDAALSGTRDAPEVSGQLGLADGRLVYPPLGIVLEDLQVKASSPRGAVLRVEASARAGDGQLTLDGTTRLDAGENWPTSLGLQGNALPLVRLPDAEVSLEPDLELDIRWPEIRVSGKAAVPSASFVLRELPAEAVRPLPETVVHDESGGSNGRQPVERVRVYAEMDLSLGDDVRYSALGLEGTVSGGLHVSDEPGRTPQADGKLLLNGRYTFYGQELTISDGQLLFSGPLNDPILDVKATRKTGDVTAGVRLFGPASRPSTELFSEPSMGESDALSYLMFGRPLASSGDGNGAINNAAVALGVVSALPVSSRAQSSLGLDELRLDTGTYDTGAIMAGKQIGPGLYIRYTYGLFNRLGGIAASYQLNEKLGVEARSAEHQSIEVTYTLKRD